MIIRMLLEAVASVTGGEVVAQWDVTEMVHLAEALHPWTIPPEPLVLPYSPVIPL